MAMRAAAVKTLVAAAVISAAAMSAAVVTLAAATSEAVAISEAEISAGAATSAAVAATSDQRSDRPMTLPARWLWLPCLAACWLLNPPAVRAGSRGVVDGAGLFTQRGFVEEMTRRIDDIQRRYGVDVLIETVATTPADRATEFKQLGQVGFFDLWAEERAFSANVDGVYILICAAPRHVEVYVHGDSAEKAFDKHSSEQLRKTLAHRIANHPYDAVRDALAFVQERLDRTERDAKRGGWSWVVAVMLAIVGVWLVVVVVRRFQGGKTVAPPSVVTSGALAGQSVYQAIVKSPLESPAPSSDAATLPYPTESPREPSPERTVHG
jgi:hypothetical protein